MLVSSMSIAQESNSLKKLRVAFQEIKSEEDIEEILAFNIEEVHESEQEVMRAYQAAGTCMMANYVFSPKSKLKYFNEGKGELEELILFKKDVEKVYLRLLIQLNIPKFLNYHKNIESDIDYLNEYMAKSPLEPSFKKTMIENLISVTNKKGVKEALLDIEVEEKC